MYTVSAAVLKFKSKLYFICCTGSSEEEMDYTAGSPRSNRPRMIRKKQIYCTCLTNTAKLSCLDNMCFDRACSWVYTLFPILSIVRGICLYELIH